MALSQSARKGAKPAKVYAVRVGPKTPGNTRYILGFVYPAKPVKKRTGERLLHEGRLGAVVAPQAIALLGRGPRVYGWPHSDVGLAAARDTAKRIPGATVVRILDWRGGPQ